MYNEGQTVNLLEDKTFLPLLNYYIIIVDVFADELLTDRSEISILLRIENGVDTSAENLTLNVVVPENSTLYEAMEHAAIQHNDTFR